MVLPVANTMFVLFGKPRWTQQVAEHHGWLFRYEQYDIIPDMVHLISIATGDKVYVAWDEFQMWFRELADAGTTERAA